VNNAGIALLLPGNSSHSEVRENFSSTFNANITSIYTTSTIFLPLLRGSSEPKVINISSGRASITRSANGDLPPTKVLSYGVSKTALNALTVEMQRAEDAAAADSKVQFWVANPGHCKTAFNGFRGTKDPLEGAEVVFQLVTGERGRWKKGAFWEFEEGAMREVPW
jgi:NAD(P)-dependent dehydrogenase (short-subunit alcohol dehydrogenase family)